MFLNARPTQDILINFFKSLLNAENVVDVNLLLTRKEPLRFFIDHRRSRSMYDVINYLSRGDGDKFNSVLGLL